MDKRHNENLSQPQLQSNLSSDIFETMDDIMTLFDFNNEFEISRDQESNLFSHDKPSDSTEIIERFKLVVAANPWNPRLGRCLTDLYKRQGNFNEAIEFWK